MSTTQAAPAPSTTTAPLKVTPPAKKAGAKKELSASSKKKKLARLMRFLKAHPKLLAKARAAGTLEELKPKRTTLPKGPKKVWKEQAEKKKVQVPESVGIRRNQRLRHLARRMREIHHQHVMQDIMKPVLVRRAQKHLAEYRQTEQALLKNKREARSHGNFYREDDPKLILVIRLKGIMGLTPRTRKILKLFRLPQMNNATFVRANKATVNMLRLVAPYVAYGYPNLATVRRMIYKRAFAKIAGRRIPIVDNKLVAHHLGRYGIICMEDLIHEIYTVGKHFKQANRFLWQFKLRNPIGGYVRKSTLYVEGGDGGNREEKINSLVRRMI